MNSSVSLAELLLAYEWVSAGDAGAGECEVYVSREMGTHHWCGDGADEDPPDDVGDESLYVAVPRRSELDLGRSLALCFVAERLPGEHEATLDYFRKRGAYARFKSMLERNGELDAWHDYEQQATETALRAWCSEHGFTVVA